MANIAQVGPAQLNSCFRNLHGHGKKISDNLYDKDKQILDNRYDKGKQILDNRYDKGKQIRDNLDKALNNVKETGRCA